jgi:hypothetical protein
MPYSNECVFLKIAGDDGNPISGPDLVDLDPSLTNNNNNNNNNNNTTNSNSTNSNNNNNNNNTSQTPSSTGHPSQSWSSSAAESSLPTRERGSGSGSSYVPVHGMMPDFGRVDVDSTTSLDESGRPTPNSSTGASDHLVAPGGGGRVSGRASFEASPVGSLNSMPGTTARGGPRGGGVSEFFGDPSAYTLQPSVSSGMSPGEQQQRFSMAEAEAGGFGSAAGWSDIEGQPALADGVLRSILAMGPMDTMDLRWDTNP